MKKTMKAVAALMLMTAVVCVAGCNKSSNPFTVSGSYEGHDYVDLGLPSGTLWATCNVGAEMPEGYGDYFAWGETQPKSIYDWNTYKYGFVNSFDNVLLTKYNTDSRYGEVDNITVLQASDDAATANWGSGWCMPTREQWKELRDKTTRTWTVQNGVSGYLLVATNGGQLFLPASGYHNDDNLNSVEVDGIYWSSSLYEGIPDGAYDFGFYSGNSYVDLNFRCIGQSVRPVRSTK